MWRESNEYAKWRWILFDSDYGFGMPNPFSSGYTNNTLAFATNSNNGEMAPPWATLLFRKLLQNDNFKTRFLQKFAVYLNTLFHPDTVVAQINHLQDVISPEMSRHISRWRGDTYGFPILSYGNWVDNAIGRIEANGIDLPEPGDSGEYFKEIPLELEANPRVGYRFANWEGIENQYDNPLTITTSADTLTISAVFEAVTINLIPSVISSDTVLTLSNSPYYTSGDVFVETNTTLQVEEGVEIYMASEASIIINGDLQINGTEQNPVIIKPNDYALNWGALCFVNASDSSVLSNLTLIGATKGIDFSRDKAAISAFNSRLSLNHLRIEDGQMPVFAQYGKMVVRDSYLESETSGDLINIKYATSALVENCLLKGNNKFDSDGIDYDQISNGIIRGNRIYNFYGFNSDGIDLGEGSQNILIENNLIYNIDDKGISIGHGSTADIKRNLIANCGQGVGIKDDGSFGYIEHCTFYGNRYGIACFEKNIGIGGGTAEVINSIIADSRIAALFIDALSTITISYSLSNTDQLGGLHNIFNNPHFLNNLYLAANSPAINSGNPTLPQDPDGSLPDMGMYPYDQDQLDLIINEIHYHPIEGEAYEFMELINNGISPVNLNGYRLEGDIIFSFPDDIISPGEIIVLAKNSALYQEENYEVYQWDQGSLPDGPGTVLLYDDQGEMIDFVDYDNKNGWPKEPDGLGPSLELHHTSLENMISSNWRGSYTGGGTPGKANNSVILDGIYINEFLAGNSSVNVDEYGEFDDWLEIYNSNEFPVNTGGLYLTDDFQDPCKYQIPWNAADTTTIGPGGFLLAWTDGQPGQGILHTNFRLSISGEQIGLVQVTDSDTLFLDSLTFIEQVTDISSGRYPDGSATWQSFSIPTPGDSNSISTGLADKPDIPLRFFLSQNYPNPFNPTTKINYELPITNYVDLSIYNLLGQKVALLVNKKQHAGYHQVEWNASEFATGIYFYRLVTEKFVKIKKMILIK
jgi:hypothetical protein